MDHDFSVSTLLPPGPGNPRNSEGDFLRLNDGRILFAWSRYTGSDWSDDAACDIAAIWSSDNGKTFTAEPAILVRAADFGVKNIMSVSLLRMANGDLGLFFIVKCPGFTDRVVLMRSRDEGLSFYSITHVLPAISGYYVLNNCRVLRTSAGRLIAPAAYHRSGSDPDGNIRFDGRAEAVFYYSDDDGFTWSEAPDHVTAPFTHTQTGLQEPGVTELPNGAIYAYFRTDKYCQYESLSYDGGLHWTKAQPSGFTSPRSPLKLARDPFSGRYLAVWNPVPEYNGRVSCGWGRTPLVMAWSDDGVHFGDPILLENEPGRGYCYPAVFFADESTVLLSYCSGSDDEGCCLCRTTVARIGHT